jgi:hypothetical protein
MAAGAVADMDDREAERGQSDEGRPRGAARSDQSGPAAVRKVVPKRFGETAQVGIAAGQPAADVHHQIGRSDRFGALEKPVQQRQDRDLVGHGDVAAEPVRIAAPPVEIGAQARPGHRRSAIFPLQPELLQPEGVDERRLGMVDRVADHLGPGGPHQLASRRRSRR